MKILVFIDNLRAGGKERRCVELLKGLNTASDTSFEILVMNEEIYFQEVFTLNTKIHYLIRRTKKDISVFAKFYKICKEYKPDIVHCWNDMTAVIAVPACKLLSINLVNGMVSDAPIHQNILNKEWLCAQLTFPFSNVIIGNSHAGLKAYKAPESKSLVIYNGFDFKRIENLVSSDKIRNELKIKTKFVIGMVASFSKYKDYSTYFNAAQSVLSIRNDVTFIAIGNNTESVESMSLIDKRYQESIKLIGKRSNIESYIMVMDICVLATFTEGISNSILEYMALGKPVIATSGGGTNEIVDDQKTGFLVKKTDEEELAEKINLLLDNFDLRTEMGRNGQERVHQMFSIDSMVSKYMSCYENLQKKKGIKKRLPEILSIASLK
jgi:glycosyltransferase involved in cell wall biosynthesis